MSDLVTDVRHRPPVAVIHLRGDLDAGADAAMTAAYDQAAVAGIEAIVLDFTESGYINSTGIALVVRLLAEARKAAVAIRVCGLTEHYQHIFQITRLADFMTFFLDEEAAVRGGTAAPA